MKITSIIAIYFLFWVMSAFMCLPFGVRTHDEEGIPKVPGQADSAPANFNPRLIAKRATVLAAILFGLFYANYSFGWLTTDSLDLASALGIT
jgi:predicted secreted protein